jgi:hypothetical protein
LTQAKLPFVALGLTCCASSLCWQRILVTVLMFDLKLLG